MERGHFKTPLSLAFTDLAPEAQSLHENLSQKKTETVERSASHGFWKFFCAIIQDIFRGPTFILC